MKVTFVIGGRNSGKTSFALDLLNKHIKKYYIATAVELDDEMRSKIELHKEERKLMNIKTIECPYDLHKIWDFIDEDGVVLLDCLTLWKSNFFHKSKEVPAWDTFKKELLFNFNFKGMAFKELIIITNEIGMGKISLNKEERELYSLMGNANKLIGSLCNEAWVLICGIEKKIKG